MPIAIVLRSRISKRIRKPRPVAGSVKQVAKSDPLARDDNAHQASESEIVRISYTCPPSEEVSLNDLRAMLLKATGIPVSRSAVIRAGVTALSERPVNDVIALVENLTCVKPGRKPKPR